MFPCFFSLSRSIVSTEKNKTKKNKTRKPYLHAQPLAFLAWLCAKNSTVSVAVSIKQYRGPLRVYTDVCFCRCFLAATEIYQLMCLKSHLISGNSLTKTATSTWMDGVSSKRMMSARWQRMLSNHDALDSWGKEALKINECYLKET